MRKLSWMAPGMLLLAGCAGCFSSSSKSTETPFILGDLVPADPADPVVKDAKPVDCRKRKDPSFVPASLGELDAKVEWKERPVLDSFEQLKERQAQETPLVSAEEALELRNTGKENNDKLLSGLGRLPTADNQVNWDAEINRYHGGDINNTFPLFLSSTPEFDIQELTAFGVLGFNWTVTDDGGEFQKFAAKETVVSWHSSADGLYDKIVLRDDMVWSNGEPITAEDIEYSYQLIMTEAVPVRAVRQGTDQLKWVKAYDKRTVVFFHKARLVTNDDNISFPVVPKKVFDGMIDKDPLLKGSAYAALDDNPVVGGPYKIVGRSRGQETVLERREDYYTFNGKEVRPKPMFKTIRFKVRPDASTALLALKTGDLDEMELTPTLWQNQTDDDEFYKRNTKVYATEWTSFQFTWNHKEPFFEDKKVRLALAYAYDHEELLKTLLFDLCEPCTGNFHPTSKWAPKPSPTPIKRDLDKAEALLDEAGWVDSDGDGVRDKTIKGRKVKFEFIVNCTTAPERISICNLLVESLRPIGINCTVKPLEFPALIEKMQNRDFQAAFNGWGSGTDPDSSENLFKTGEMRNYANYSNTRVDELFQQGKTETDIAKRQEIYRELARILWDDQVFCWLYYRNAFYGFNKSLRGYTFSPRGPYHFGPGFGSIYKPAAQP